jgi:hypothetical protein
VLLHCVHVRRYGLSGSLTHHNTVQGGKTYPTVTKDSKKIPSTPKVLLNH